MTRIAVLGAGAWGTAIAQAAARAGHRTTLWGRDAAQVAAMQGQRCNARYLPKVRLADGLQLTADPARALQDAELAIVATPLGALRTTLARLPAALPAVWLCKGLEVGTDRMAHEIAREVRPHAPGAVLSGPSFALEVARGQPTALVCASGDAALVAHVTALLHGPTLRIYASDDVVGVEIGGATKNVIAIAAGILDGLQADQGGGLNARAALVTRGLAEMTRLGTALGARRETFMGLSGLGDLVLTATGPLSRNRAVGLALADGRTLPQALAELGHVAEGVRCAPAIVERARSVGVQMPIASAVVDVLEGRLAPREAALALMARDATSEF